MNLEQRAGTITVKTRAACRSTIRFAGGLQRCQGRTQEFQETENDSEAGHALCSQQATVPQSAFSSTPEQKSAYVEL